MSLHRCSWVLLLSLQRTAAAAHPARFGCALRGTQCFGTSFLSMHVHLLVEKIFLFISHMSWIYAVSSLAAQSWLRSSFCSFKFDSLSPQLAPCRAPAPCGAGSCCPTCPGPGSCSIIQLQEGPLQQKLLPCPSLGSVCSSGAQKTKKDLGGKKSVGGHSRLLKGFLQSTLN